MRIPLKPLRALCLLMLAGCGSLLSGYEDTLCNEDGTCPMGYFCVPETNRCREGIPPPGQDDAGTDGGTDAGVCAGALACADDDGCCPTGCHANNDSDCQAVCGNGQTEASGGEVCDDGNRLNGDNCDPTCRYFNAMSTLSGIPGSRSFADGQRDIARFHGPAGITSDGRGNFFITDSNNSTVRHHRLGLTTTLAGLSYRKQSIDGLGSDAGFVSPTDVAYLDGVLYIVDAPGTPGARLRRLDLDGGVVSTVDAGTSLAGLRGVDTDEGALLLVDSTGLRRWVPSGALPPVLLAAESRLRTVVDAPCEDVIAHPLESNAYYLACNRGIVRVSDGGVSLFAGNAGIPGCTGWAEVSAASALFTRARSLAWAMAGTPSAANFRLYITDPTCHTLVQMKSGQFSAIAGMASTPGYGNSTDPRDARFNAPYGVEAIDSSSGEPTVHVADFDNAAVRTMFPPNATPPGVTTLAGLPPTTVFRAGDAGTTSRYTQVTTLAVDGEAGLLYAYAPAPRQLFQVALGTGVPQVLMTVSASSQPLGLAVLDGTLYVSLSNRTVARLVPGSPATLAHVAGQAGSTSGVTDGDLATAILYPSDLATDGQDLFFHDLSAKTVRKIDLADGLVTTLAGGAAPRTYPDGGPELLFDGEGDKARFANPVDLTSDGTSLYLLDGLFANLPRSVVRKVDPVSKAVSTLAGDPFIQWSAQDGVGPAARFAGATRLTTDGRVLFISDPGGGYGLPDLTSPAIRMLDLSTGQLSTMVGARGQWTIRNGSGTGAAVNAPGPIAFDPTRQWIIFFDYEEGVFQRIR